MKKQVIIVGGGFGGLETALSLWDLMKSSLAVTLIDRNPCHSFIPSIPEVISGKIRARDIQIPLSVLLGPTGINFVQDEVVSIDPARLQVTTRTGAMDFDYLVLSSGAEENFSGVTGAEKFSRRFRSPEDAGRIHSDVRLLLDDRKRPCNLIVAGGGAEGVEVAGELIDLVRERCKGDFDSGRITVELTGADTRLLPAFPSRAQDFARDYLVSQGVRISTGMPIVAVRKNKVVFDSGVHRDMSLLIWTGGIQPARLLQGVPLSKDTQGWLSVTDRLHSPDNDHVYGVGDSISIYGERGPVAVSRLAHYALDQAIVAGLNIYYDIHRRRKVGYAPKSKPQIISLGKNMGMLAREDCVMTGQSFVLLKKLVQVRYLMTCLTRPALSAIEAFPALSPIPAKFPGAEFVHLARLLSPL